MDVGRKFFLIGLFLMPFFQGLYFYHEIFVTMVLLLILLMVICISQKGLYIEKSTTMLFLLGLFVFYLLTCFYGVDRGMSFIGALKILPYFVFYLLYTQLYTEQFKEKLLATLIVSALMAGVLGILAFFIPQLSKLLIQNGRLGGVFQYANSYGLYCVIGILLIIRRKEKGFLQVWSIGVLTAATVLTFSRSMIFIGLIVLLVGILVERKHAIYHIMGLIFGGLMAFILINALNLSLLSARLADTSMKTSEWVTRMVYYKDALKMILHFPFGTGYMGYFFTERTYQTSSTYLVKFVHSNLLQYALDIGILGAVMCCLFFFTQVFSKKLDTILKLILIMIALHGLIDFDFEFPYILVMLLIFIGIKKDKLIFQKKRSVLQLSLMGGLLAIYFYMIIPTGYAFDGNYEKATYFYPLYTEAQVKELAQIKETNEEGAILAREITAHNPYNVEAYAYLTDYYLLNKDYKKAKVFAEKTMGLNPLNIKYVEIYSTILIECSIDALSKGDQQVARHYLELVQSIPLYLEELAKERMTDDPIRHVPSLTLTDVLITNLNKANQMTLELD